ncbi:YhcN/YlaJ family sporulation lipoprotein [Pseudalkalibacillus sp. Hm43]|uniref:YhcN/YlaJ family sporulation lipoprotein n=1 Tax=Pseudalkalibacillus sp. Hm43 TaxID=3450742 RepID=UPI003F4235CA
MRNIPRLLILSSFLILISCQNNQQDESIANDTKPIEVRQSVEYNKEERKSSRQISKRLVELSMKVPDVKDATAVVVGKYAIVGIDVDDNLDRSRVGSIKYSVAEALQHDPYGANAAITADPDIFTRLQEMGKQIAEGKPIGGIMEELAAITGRLIPEVPGQLNKKEPDPIRKNDKNLPQNKENELQNQQEKQGKSKPSDPDRVKEQQ